MIECKLEALRTRDWGWNSFPLGVGALPSYFKEPYVHCFRFDDARRSTEYVQGIKLELAPFLGVMGVSLSFITQQLTRVDSRWLIERRSVRSGAK